MLRSASVLFPWEQLDRGLRARGAGTGKAGASRKHAEGARDEMGVFDPDDDRGSAATVCNTLQCSHQQPGITLHVTQLCHVMYTQCAP